MKILSPLLTIFMSFHDYSKPILQNNIESPLKLLLNYVEIY